MDTLNFQDAAFLRLESPSRPFHVGGLMLFRPPQGARPDYLRRLASRLAEALPQADPLFLRTLDPAHPALPRWREAGSIDASRHLLHYALPAPGRMQDLLSLVSLAHERLLDRSRPLWEWHLIEGLADGRFAVYCKIHHALIDGTGALRLLQELLTSDPRVDVLRRIARERRHVPREQTAAAAGWLTALSQGAESLREQGRALPELGALFARMRREAGEGMPPLPFTAPHTPLNGNISARRRIVVADLPLASLRRIGAFGGGTINDALLATCGAALRAYLGGLGALPRQTLLAGVPVSVRGGGHAGNALSTLVCPFETTREDPLRRLRNIARVTRRAKADLASLSGTARRDYMNLVLLPAMVLTLAHAATSVPPVFNLIVSNVPGPARPLYLAGARLEAIYPLSVITDAMAMNVTAVSCGTRLCIAVTTCPDDLPGIEAFDRALRAGHRELQAAVRG